MISTSNKTIAAIIPAYNEARSIGAIVQSVMEHAVPIVIDDGSTDTTSKIAMENGAIVYNHGKNLGYERALESGLIYARSSGFKYAITLDADGQHDPSIIKKFQELLENNFDLVVGRRQEMQRIGETVFSFVSRFIWGIYDPLCGMKAYNLERLGDPSIISKHYDSVGTKYALCMISTGCKVCEINITTSEREDVPRFGVGYLANKKILSSLVRGLASYGLQRKK